MLHLWQRVMTLQWSQVGYGLEKEVHVTTGQVWVEMHMTDWAKMQREDPVLNALLDWLKAKRRLI